MQNLNICLRSWGKQNSLRTLTYICYLKETLGQAFKLNFFIATDIEKPIILPDTQDLNIIYTNMHSFSKSLNKIISMLPADSPTLTLSIGVKIKLEHILNALSWIKLENIYSYGWQIEGLNNNGIAPGRGWYNTAALFSEKFTELLKNRPLPDYIDNKKEGYLTVNNKPIPIGGNEEIIMMYYAINYDQMAYFVLNTKDILSYNFQEATDINFEEKLLRKEKVANYYIDKKLSVQKEDLWQHLILIK
ncbi:MAG: hypothetical protein ACK4OM_02825 [Alphaproteobacteria bacterium]